MRARPASRRDRFRKLARRNKRLVAASLAAVAGALLIMGTLAVSNVLIRRERARTAGQRDLAEKALLLAGDRAEQIRDGLESLKPADALLDRGRWYIGESRWDDAHADLTRASRIRPDHVPVWVELGGLHARLGLWDLAAEDFARELALAEPDSTGRWYRHALIRLSLGDAAGSRRLVRSARDRFRGTMNWAFMADLVRLGVLAPGDPSEFADLIPLAEKIAPRDWGTLYLLGMAHLRSGNGPEAVVHLRRAKEDGEGHPRGPIVLPALALALHRAARPDEARRALDAATQALDRWTERAYEDEGDGQWIHHLGAGIPWPVEWNDWLECRLIHDEACRRILGKPPAPDPRLLVLRARAWAALRRHDEADVAYRGALALLPDSPRVLLEAHRNRGYARVRGRDWAGAASEFAAAVAVRPEEVRLHTFLAVALLEAGDEPGYHAACATCSIASRLQAIRRSPATSSAPAPSPKHARTPGAWATCCGSPAPSAISAPRRAPPPSTVPVGTKRPPTAWRTPRASSDSGPRSGASWPWPANTSGTSARLGSASRRPLGGSMRPTRQTSTTRPASTRRGENGTSRSSPLASSTKPSGPSARCSVTESSITPAIL